MSIWKDYLIFYFARRLQLHGFINHLHFEGFTLLFYKNMSLDFAQILGTNEEQAEAGLFINRKCKNKTMRLNIKSRRTKEKTNKLFLHNPTIIAKNIGGTMF